MSDLSINLEEMKMKLNKVTNKTLQGFRKKFMDMNNSQGRQRKEIEMKSKSI